MERKGVCTKKILFLDDDALTLKYHIKQLRKVFDVEVRNDVDRALEGIRANPESWAGVILDVMMPPGRLEPFTPNGMDTGLFFLKELRKLRFDLPVLVVTNLNAKDLNDRFKPEIHVRLVQKTLIDPEKLVQYATEMFGT